MKKIVSLKSVMIGILSFIIIGATTVVFATDSSILETGSENNATEVTALDLNQAQTIPTDTNYASTSGTTNDTPVISSGTNQNSVYNTVDDEEEEEDSLPQTGIEDYNIGILLIVCVIASVYTYKKMKEYKNI